MKIQEILTFHGSPCTKDCSGHEAGYSWSKNYQKMTNSKPQCISHSNSFNNGCNIANQGLTKTYAKLLKQKLYSLIGIK